MSKSKSWSWFTRQCQNITVAGCGWVPLSLGNKLRQGLYRLILGKIGANVGIEPRVELEQTQGITLGESVRLRRGVRLRAYGDDSKICLANRVHLDRGVDIRTHKGGTIALGERVYIGPYTCLSGDSIQIGKMCLIASHVGIYANNHTFADPNLTIKEQPNTYKGIVIEEDCWLGSGVRVLDGVTIGKGSVIGAGAVVTKNIPPYSIAVGVPAKVVGSHKQNVESMNAETKMVVNEVAASLQA